MATNKQTQKDTAKAKSRTFGRSKQTSKDTAKAKSRTFGRSKRAKEEEEEELLVQEEILRNNPMMQPTDLMPQQGGFNAPAVNPLLDPSAAFSPTVNPIEAPVDILQGGTLSQAPPQTIGAQPSTPSFGAAPQAAAPQAAPQQPRTGIQVPLDLGLGIPSLLDPMLSMGDFSGTGGGIGDFFSGLKEGSIFRSAGPAPSEIRAGTAAGETPRNFPEVPLATPADFTAPTPAQLAAPASDGSQIPKFGEEGFQFAERGSPQDFFLSQTNGGTTALSQEQIDRGQAFADQRGMNFDPLTGFSQGTEAAPQQGLASGGDFGLTGFNPRFNGQTPSQFMRGEDTAASTTFQGTDAQGRLRQFDSPEAQQANIAQGQADFAQASTDREARQAARSGFGEAVSDRDRRAARGDGISDADRRDMAKANRPGASAGDVARGNKVAALVGVDLRTGRPPEKAVAAPTPEEIAIAEAKAEGVRLDIERKKQVIEAGRKPDATNFEKFQSDLELADLPPAAKKAALYKKFGIDPFDFPEGGDAGATGTASDTGAAPSEGGYTAQEESGIRRVMEANNISREEAIKALEDKGKLKKKTMNSSGSQ